MIGKIFINYRRGDEPGFAQALLGRLEQAFPAEQLFIDVDNIAPGEDFVRVLESQVAQCEVLLVLIGKGWLDASDKHGNRRLDDPSDFVRIEIESALRQSKRVIPVLVHEAQMPHSDELPEAIRPLAKRNAVRLTHERFRADVQGLVKALQQVLEEGGALRLNPATLGLDAEARVIKAPATPIQVAPPPRSWSTSRSSAVRAAVYGGCIAMAVALAVVGILFLHSSSPPPLLPAVIAKQPATPSPADAAALSGPLAGTVAAANRGDPIAQNQLGVKYARGENGLTRDDTKAIEWYRKAANQGLAKAQTNLGDMYFFGRGGLTQSYLDALSWYLKASQQDWPDAQYRLGYMYEKGFGTDKDPAKALQLYRSAAEHGYAEAQNLLGILYATGTGGVTQDDKQAVDWYQKAADQSFAKAERNLGDMYFFGRGVDRDYKQAMTWYGKASDQNFADAQFRLGFMYEKGLGVDQSNQNAIDQYTKAVRNGSVEAQRALDRLRPP